mgnify:CR=1 FL=1
MNKKQLIAVVTLVIFTSPLLAQDKHPIDRLEEECINKHLTTTGMANCTYDAADKWDAEMNKYYKLLMKILSKDDRIKLKQAQLTWLKYRDAERKVLDEVYLGSPPTILISIKAYEWCNMIKTRALQLKSLYDSIREYR